MVQLLKKGLIRGVVLFMLFGMLAIYHQWNGQTEAVYSDFYIGGIVFLLGLTSVIYQIERWSFRKQAIVHYAVMHVTVLPFLLFSGLFQLTSFQDVLHVYIAFNQYGLFLFATTFLVAKVIRLSRRVKVN